MEDKEANLWPQARHSKGLRVLVIYSQKMMVPFIVNKEKNILIGCKELQLRKLRSIRKRRQDLKRKKKSEQMRVCVLHYLSRAKGRGSSHQDCMQLRIQCCPWKEFKTAPREKDRVPLIYKHSEAS